VTFLFLIIFMSQPALLLWSFGGCCTLVQYQELQP